jgi:sugar fermentation stimulation protein A
MSPQAPIGIPLQARMKGRLVRRYKRFLADVELPNGEVVTVHCPNPGSMLGQQRPGSAVRCSTSDDPRRKLRHTLEMIRVGRVWVGLHALRANQLAARALEAESVPGLEGYAEIRPEVKAGEGSRLDFVLSGHPSDPRTAWVEVKSVTLRGEKETTSRSGQSQWSGLFPDAVTERGRRHMLVLKRLREEGHRAILLFVVQRADCYEVRPADEIDPAYGEALREAAEAGVEVFALGTRVTAHRIAMERMRPVVL